MQTIISELTNIDDEFDKANSDYKQRYFFSNFLQADFETYKQYLRYKIPPDYSEIYPHLNTILHVHNAVQLVLYKKHLEREINGEPKKVKVRSEITISQQLLLLHFLDIINTDSLKALKNESKAKLFATLLKAEGAENIRRRLSDLHNGDSINKQRENIQFCIDLFEEYSLAEPFKKATSALKKLNKPLRD